jgi:hypothetical protein
MAVGRLTVAPDGRGVWGGYMAATSVWGAGSALSWAVQLRLHPSLIPARRPGLLQAKVVEVRGGMGQSPSSGYSGLIKDNPPMPFEKV